MKNHQIAMTVNRLREIAISFHNSQQLRERIAQEIRPLQKEWVGLSHDQKMHLNDVLNLQGRFAVIDAIEQAVKTNNDQSRKEAPL